MDVKLESLIDKIKQDGIEEAKKVSKEIVGKANIEASNIIKEAENKACNIEEKAKAEAAKLKFNSKNSLRQASRDLVLVVKEELISLLNKILKDRIGEALTPDFIGELISKIIDKWSPTNNITWEILLNKSDKEKIEKALLVSLKEKTKKTIEIRVSKTIEKDFVLA